ncbi:AB hydrolase superfamily protein YisY [Cyberlindnera fabianii]|uniref:AB hydrolase superfamily protein YisY n=1 Tax=Cyberlindnera fabianii TaxID=36022 RepID=A0A1V2L251_CYBFA|nr:AB hydrolase superfamily protein YisY [Cyberlindnera fabianii]
MDTDYQYIEPTAGTVYEYTPRLQVFEFAERAKTSTNAVLFIGGLTDGLLTVPYLPALSKQLPDGWNLYKSSSLHLMPDGQLDLWIETLMRLVSVLLISVISWVRQKVVLFGNSTGCQDSIHYALNKADVKVDGIVLHSPVSDRYACGSMFEEKGQNLEDWNKEAKEWGDKYGMEAVLPPKFSKWFFDTNITAYRWLSLFTVGGDDDYFSEDLTDDALKNSFGKLNIPTLVLYSEKDEFVPSSVDKSAIVERWRSFTPQGIYSKYSTVIKGCSHQCSNLSDPGAFGITY